MKMVLGLHQTQGVTFVVNLYSDTHEYSDEFLNHIVRETGETWISLVNVETKEQSN
jgi:hypothetical protein